MSFPNIPDIKPDINIAFDDAINLLLTSIAMEEISLSKMLDAETDKILHVLGNSMKSDGESDYSFEDVLAVNKSVNNTIKNMIKLQMLLQFKLENIKEILPSTSTSSTTTFTSTSTTSSSTTISTTSIIPLKTIEPPDPIYRKQAVIYSTKPFCPKKSKKAYLYKDKSMPNFQAEE